MAPARLLSLLLLVAGQGRAEYVRLFRVQEGVPPGTRIGFIGEAEAGSSAPPRPPYLVVPVADSPIDTDLDIDQNTGEIRTKVTLDRESRSLYSLSAIPLTSDGENIRVSIEVEDVNDNSPTFPSSIIEIGLPENTARDSKRQLPPALDRDLGIFNTQRYDIVSGNTKNAFRLSSARDREGVLRLDLQVNGFLDREAVDSYKLIIEAQDGGSPALKGTMMVNVTILDLNDNPPSFLQQRYYATVPENVTLGASVIQVSAEDPDNGTNGEVTYTINRRQSDSKEVFAIDEYSGLLTVNKRLDFESKESHELVVVARDKGDVPQETTAFITVRITDINDNQPTIRLDFKTPGGRAEVREDMTVGQRIADVMVADPDEPTKLSSLAVTLTGDSGHFKLERMSSGYHLVLARQLDRETADTFNLLLEALDEGSPPLRASLRQELRVTDVNDNKPQFSEEVYYASILEAMEPGARVFQVTASDSDAGDNGEVTYRIENSAETHSDWFDIEPDTGVIVTRTQVDCETDPEPRLVVVASDRGSPPLSSSTSVRISIQDINDNEPIFERTFYNATLKENERVGLCFLKVSASDPDCGINSVVTYKIGEAANLGQKFRVKPRSGEICLAGSLDHERENSYDLTVVATDKGGLSTSTMVKVEVEDINDNAPVFFPNQYNVTLQKSVSVGRQVVVVHAEDADSAKFSEVTYALGSGNEAGKFAVDRRTGAVTITSSLGQFPSSFRLEVVAKDRTGNRGEENAVVNINVAFDPKESPIFEKSIFHFSVSEDASIFSSIGQVLPTTQNARLFIYPAEMRKYFDVNPTSGTVSTKALLDHEEHPEFLLNIGARGDDSTPLMGYCQIKVTVLDVNDNSPRFGPTLGLVSIPENSASGTIVYANEAKDRDSGKNGEVNYRLVRDAKNYFKIDQESGVLRTNTVLDYETDQSYSVRIVAYDMGDTSLSSTLTLSVLVQDMNDNAPRFEKEFYEVEVDESLPKDSQILPLNAVDLDKGKNGRLTYTVTRGDAWAADYIGLLPSSGIIFLRQPLDREKVQSISLSVKVEDHGVPPLSSEAQIKFLVKDTNDNRPVFGQTSYTFVVTENVGSDFLVGRVSAEDKDSGSNAQISYQLKSSSRAFRIDGPTGEIRSVRQLDREEASEHKMEVEAVDGGTPRLTSTTTVTVVVLDENDNKPVVVQPLQKVISVREKQPVGTVVARIVATDADLEENATLLYSFHTAGDGSLFDINQNEGIITTKIILERSQRQNYSIEVMVSDKGSPPQQAVFAYTVMVLGEDDNSLPFSKTNLVFSVPENSQIGRVVGSVRPGDQNYDLSTVWYSIIARNDKNIFDIDNHSGNLLVVRNLDADTNQEYNLKISLNDNTFGMAREVIRVKIIITDVNDNPPAFRENPLQIAVAEDSSLGSPVYTIAAQDIDNGSNGSVRYSLQEQFPANFFRIDSLSGELFLTQKLSYEVSPKVFLTVRATDSPFQESGRRTSDVAVIVTVEDVNDHTPQFVSTNKKQIQRSIDVGVAFHRLLAVDADSDSAGEIQYRIAAGDSDGTFQLDPSTGLLAVSERPRKNTYRLDIKATDGGSPQRSSSQLLQVTVSDMLTGPPKFTNSVYRAEVLENSARSSHVTTVRAVKQGSSNNLFYSLDEKISRGLFGIDERSGEIRTVGNLDREERSSYIVTVYVHDSSTPPSFDTASVLIKILDENDHAPTFEDSCYPMFVPENTDLSALHQFIATDRDAGENGAITYSLVGGDAQNKFSIDAHSGQLSASPLDHEEHAAYRLRVQAQDQGEPKKQTICEVTIRVLDRNDNDPVFTEQVFQARVKENVPEGTPVKTVVATDADSGPNAKISYSIRNGTEWIFGIDRDTGLIYTTGRLDRERRSVYTLEVVAVDEGIEDTRMAQAVVQITIEDENDSQPQFDEYPFMAQILPQLPPGGEIIRISAKDQDQGPNSDLKYAFLNREDKEKFAIDAGTGVITSKQSLVPDDGRMFHLEILVTDGGSPNLSSTGLVEIRIGQQPNVQLNFQQKVYSAEIEELSSTGVDILQVQAVRSDGRKQRVIYTFGQGNEDGTFEINSNNGLVRLQNPQFIDFEARRQFNLTIIGHAAGSENLYAYASCIISVQDKNDNKPRFTQKVYFARAWEGNNKGTYVSQVVAVDGDSIENEQLYYQIVDGNHDGAFAIDQQYSGIIKTNIVLDREIRDYYELTVTATDEGTPPLTGYTKVVITIIDINDNQPQFPRSKPIVISEGAQPGSRIGTIQANDIDSHPHLTYSFLKGGNPLNAFSIDKFSGVLSMAKKLDREEGDRYKLLIAASDGAHTVDTSVEVIVEDENDCAPIFERQVYTGSFSSNMSLPAAVLTVRAVDSDVGRNGRVSYSLLGSNIGYVDSNGTLFINNTSEIKKGTEIHLVVAAEDQGDPKQMSFVSVRLQNLQHSESSPQFLHKKFEVIIDSTAKIGTKLANLEVQQSSGNLFYSLDTPNPYMELDSTSGALILKKQIDADTVIPGTLGVSLRKNNRLGDESRTTIKLMLAGGQAALPIFVRKYLDVKLSENTVVGSQIFSLNKHGLTGKYNLKIAAGNANNTFELGSAKEAAITLKKPLDFEVTPEYKLLIFGSHGNTFDTMTLVVNVMDENDNPPFFPVTRQIHSVRENASPGTPVFVASAQDLDSSAVLSYTVTGQEFVVGETNGRVVTTRKFDYENEREFSFVLTATDVSGRTASAEVSVKIESQDEFPPVFEQPAYKYSVDQELSVGYILGRVRASDADEGPDGRVVYSMTTGAEYLRVKPETGEVVVVRTLDTGILTGELTRDKMFQEVTFVVQASTGKTDSLKSSSLIVMDVRTDVLPLAPVPRTQEGLAGWGQALIVTLVLIILILGVGIFFFRKFSVNKFLQKHLIDGQGGPADASGHYEGSLHDTGTMESSVAMSQYPPQYSDIVSQYSHNHPGKAVGGRAGGRITQSELSEQSHRSASSGRGSAEDVEEEVDHEIQMINGINEGGMASMNDTCLAEDSVSDISVQNGKEYLARLGIDTRGPPLTLANIAHGASYQTLEGGDLSRGDLTSMVYSRLAEDTMSEKNSMVSGGNNSVYARTGHPVSMTGSLSSIVHSEEELAGSYNWDYLLDWGPQYQPLAHVFQEISSLKDEGSSLAPPEARAPPIITCRPPRHVHTVGASSGGPHHARSPISHTGPLAQAMAMSPSFSPALSPLATRSPSISPLAVQLGARGIVARGVVSNTPGGHYQSSRGSDYGETSSNKAATEREMRI